MLNFFTSIPSSTLSNNLLEPMLTFRYFSSGRLTEENPSVPLAALKSLFYWRLELTLMWKIAFKGKASRSKQ